MRVIWFLMCLCAGTAVGELSPSSLQLEKYASHTKGPAGIMTTGNGALVEKRDLVALNENILRRESLMDEYTHAVRERIPERVVHAKGTGAFGYFESTYDFSNYTKAKLFGEKGKRTKVAVRFSNGVGGSDSTDIIKDTHGMAVKFYTEEGNFDLICFTTPVFAFKEPSKFLSFVHAFKKNPVTHINDDTTRWDYLSSNPESMFLFMMVFGDQGSPKNYRCVSGHPIHTYQIYNWDGESFFVRFNFLPDITEEFLSLEEMKTLASDPDYYVSDLYNAIENGNYPTWTVSVQLVSMKQFLEDNPSKIIDVTRKLPEDKYPNIPIGKLVLNENVKNQFADVEQAAYCPSNVVSGILGASDKIYEARGLAYRDAQNYRLGANFKRIPVNCPLRELTFNRDGAPYLGDNFGGMPNYFPNSYNGAVPYEDPFKPAMVNVFEEEPDNFDQARLFYTQEMSEEARERMITTIVLSLNNTQTFIQDRTLQMFANIHPDFCSRVADQLGVNNNLCSWNDNEY